MHRNFLRFLLCLLLVVATICSICAVSSSAATPSSTSSTTATLAYTIKGLPIGNAIQNFYIGEQYIYITQRINNTTYLSRLEIRGNEAWYMDRMVLEKYGHGETLDFYRYNGKDYFLVSTNGSADTTYYWSKQIARLEYEAGKDYTTYTGVKRFTNMAKASADGKSIGGDYRVAACVNGNYTIFYIWTGNKTKIVYAIYDTVKLNKLLDESNPNMPSGNSTNYCLTMPDATSAFISSFAQEGTNNLILPQGIFQGIEMSSLNSIYIAGGAEGDTPQIARITSTGKYEKLVNITNVGTHEIEGLQTDRGRLYFLIVPSTNIEEKKNVQQIYYVNESVFGINHTISNVAGKPATCTEMGLTDGATCSKCGQPQDVQEPIPATGHQHTTTATNAPTCIAEGSLVTTCDDCGTELGRESIAALGHIDAVSEAVTPNCTENGLTEGRHCGQCGEVLIAQEVIPANGHSLSFENIRYATCTEDGFAHHYRCSACEKCFADAVAKIELPEEYLRIKATGHTEAVTASVAASCTESGLTEGKHCAVCGEVLLPQEEIGILGHSYKGVVTEATCTDDGYTTYTCSVCGDSYVSDEVAAPGHSYDAEVKLPTCTVEGSVIMGCDNCGDILYTESIPALGHSFEYINDGESHKIVCKNRCKVADEHGASCDNGCDYAVTEVHSYVDGLCICGAVEITEPVEDSSLTFGAQLYLENDLTMAFRVKTDKLTSYDISTAYLVVERDIYETGAAQAMVEAMTICEYKVENGRLIFSYPGIAAAQMNDAIRASFYIKDANGQEYVSPVLNTSVATYLDGLLSASASDTKMVTLIMDMLNYGAAAQIYFDRHADAPVNVAFESFKTYASYASADFTKVLENLATTENTEGKSGKLNLGLDLGTRIGIQYKVTVPADVNVEDVTLVVTDASGKVLETLQVAGNLTDHKGRYLVNFYGFTSRDMRRVVCATAYANGEAITGTYAYSISTYAWGVQDNASLQPENLVNVTRAMLLYGDSAAAYFA